MIEIIKMKDRTLDASLAFKAMRDCGWKTKHIGEFDKWKDSCNGVRRQAKVDLYEIITTDSKKAYVLVDTFGKVMHSLNPDKQEVMNWLKDNGYKKDKDWYIEDCGMTEDTWNKWNQAEDI